MNRILLISENESDFGNLLIKTCPDVTVISPDTLSFDPDDYDALCILGGNTEEGLVLPAPLRMCVEELREQGKPVFAEFVLSISSAYKDKTLHTTHHRMVFADKDLAVAGLKTGDVLDGHENDCVQFVFTRPSAYPILTYHDYVCAHSHIEMSEEEYKKGIIAMWREDNLLACAFRLCNFRRARLAPSHSFEALIAAIIRHLAGEDVDVEFEAPVCEYRVQTVKSAEDTKDAIARGLLWYENAGMLNNGGKGGVQEGFMHHINAKDGTQRRLTQVRTDCTGETAGAYMLGGLLRDDDKTLTMGEEMFNFCFDYLQVKKGEHKGMFRWTDVAWETCYQDDVARVVLGLLLRQHFDGTVPHLDDICSSLDFLVDTTSPEGVRVSRTDICFLNDSLRKKLATYGSGLPCAHHNAYYHAVLLLAYRAGGDKRYLELAERGLGYLMSLYPETRRETSETEENCRLLLALAVLYEITKKEEHYEWLCRIMSYLDEHRHACGAVPEWDTGYKANCSRNHTGECALLANNGDPVVDLLYSNNWLPLGYAYAYLATGEQRFYDAWCEIASFMLSCQIYSNDKLLDGAWTRAFDVENWEAHGVPHDVGWAPCCIETGWTMGEILMGLEFMEQVEKITK
ncbi:MAG: hypothetical protein E7649_01995 [Ruminococcaceae bacterium]|nr:hypothetical protein [Oscillospiraceae bacterium]